MAHAVAAFVLDAVLPKVVRQQGVVRNRLVHDLLVHRPPLALVTLEQRGPTPALQQGGHFPAEVDAIAYAHVHAVAAEGRMQVRGIAGKKHAAVAIAVGDQPIGNPFVGRQDLVGKIDAGSFANERRRLDISKLHPARQLRWHEKPFIAAIHRPDEARNPLVDLPIHDGAAVCVGLIEAGRAEHDIIVARQAAGALHVRPDGRPHRAA